MAKFSIVLIHPEIPGNTGSIGRTCVALGLQLILIEPLGFDLSIKAVRRAGLDYWKHVQLKTYKDFEHFLYAEEPMPDDLFFFENNHKQNYYQADFKAGSYLVFGSETKGIPQSIIDKFSDRIYSLPMYSDKIRSLNLSNTATAAAYECLRKCEFIV